jgi:hypothetical protein
MGEAGIASWFHEPTRAAIPQKLQRFFTTERDFVFARRGHSLPSPIYSRHESPSASGAFRVFQKVLFTLMKTGPHTLSFLDYTQPYGESLGGVWEGDANGSQRKAWAEHTAWTAVDYAKGATDLDLEYAVLA